MLKKLKNKKAQSIATEYILVFFLVVGAMSAMTIYFRRAVQAQIRDANILALKTVEKGASGFFIGNVVLGYEPYYANSAATVTRDLEAVERLFPGSDGDIFEKDLNDKTSAEATSQTAPPSEAN